MTGTVDNAGRALLQIHLKSSADGMEAELEAWIDTGFTGELVLPRDRVASLGLPLGAAVKAVLADGSKVQLDAYTCLLNWFGEWKRIEVVVNQGQFPLLGVGLLMDRELRIDYRTKTVHVI